MPNRTPVWLALVGGALSTGCSSAPATGVLPTEVTFTMHTTMPAGSEAEHCKFVRAPAEGFLVNDDTVVYTEGSHHFLLYETPYDDIPTVDERGQALAFLNEEGVFDCSAGATLGFTVTNLIGGSQNGKGEPMARFPEGVAMRIRPNAVLLMNAHYINPSSQTLEPDVTITLHGIEEQELVHEGGLLFWYDLFIKVPALSSAHATTTCNIASDITLFNLQSHMHQRGVDYSAEVIAPDDTRSEIYRNSEWENVPVEVYEPGLEVAAGSRIEYTCFYDNAEMRDVYQGARSTDEMCMLVGSYYPADKGTALCAYNPDQAQATNFMGAEWKGQGTATCAESLGCFQDAVSGGGGGDFYATLARVTECVVAADPAVSGMFSDAVGCTFATARTGGSPLEECLPAYAVCNAN